jgi:hypothetical protein
MAERTEGGQGCMSAKKLFAELQCCTTQILYYRIECMIQSDIWLVGCDTVWCSAVLCRAVQTCARVIMTTVSSCQRNDGAPIKKQQSSAMHDIYTAAFGVLIIVHSH